jgi:ribonuclease P protein component
VVRSRVKRRLRAVTAERLDRLPAGWLVVVRANPASSTASSADLADDLDAALSRLLKSVAVAGGVPDRTGGVAR